MNWSKLPLLRILLPFATGIIIQVAFAPPFHFSILLIGLFAFMVMLYLTLYRTPYSFRNYFGYILHIYLFLFAYTYTWYSIDIHTPNHFQHSIASVNTLRAKVLSVESKVKRTQIQLKVLDISSNTLDFRPCSGRLILSFSKTEEYPDFRYGDQIILKGTIQKIKSKSNPKAFNYALFLNRKNIFYQIFVQPDDCRLLRKGKTFHPLRIAGRLRMRCMNVLHEHLQQNSEWMVGKALLFGHRSDLDQQIKKAYTATGAIHILAVSGLHVGIICLMLQFCLQFLDRHSIGKWLRTILSIVSIWFFALFTGASSSVLRAAMLCSFVLIGQTLGRNSNINNTLAASALLLLLFNPLLLFDVGFQLSYLAVLGIIHFQRPIYQLLFFKSSLLDYFWQISAVSFAAQIGTLPISIYYFHQFPSYFWLSGLLLIPAAFIIIALGIFILAFQAIPVLASLLGKVLQFIIWLCNSFIFFLEELPGHLITGLWLSRFEVIIAYVILLSFLLVLHFRRSTYYLILALSCCLLTSSLAYKKWQRFTQKELVIYAAKGHSIVDFIYGHSLVSLESADLQKNTIGWSAGNYRAYKGIQDRYPFVFNHIKTSKTKHWYHQDEFIQFFTLKMLIPKEDVAQAASFTGCLDILLLRKDTKADLDQLIHDYAPKFIIIDQSNHYQTIKRWEVICTQRGQKAININQSGAFQLTIKNLETNEKNF